MGGVLSKIVFKNKHESCHPSATCLWDILADDIDGDEALLRDVVAGKKCVLVVNVAT